VPIRSVYQDFLSAGFSVPAVQHAWFTIGLTGTRRGLRDRDDVVLSLRDSRLVYHHLPRKGHGMEICMMFGVWDLSGLGSILEPRHETEEEALASEGLYKRIKTFSSGKNDSESWMSPSSREDTLRLEQR
jgi:hypothetical protein